MAQEFRRGDVVYARKDLDRDVPTGARGVVVDVYREALVVAFRWSNRTLRKVRQGEVDNETFAEVGPEDLTRKAPPLPAWAK